MESNKESEGFSVNERTGFRARKQKRNIGAEILEGLQAIKDHYEGKITLRIYAVAALPLPEVDAQLIRDTRTRRGGHHHMTQTKLKKKPQH